MTANEKQNIPSKRIELFCGTGGVGKTTIATSRALHLAKSGKKILLVTIDPSKRLKEVLGLNEENAGDVETIFLNRIDQSIKSGSLDALLMNPKSTIKYIVEKTKAKDMLENQIIKILAKPYGGMSEILSIVELKRHLNENKYDSIILDTPPGKHFIDFLNSCKKINIFFDNSFIEMFKYLKKPTTNISKSLIGTLISSGAKKILGYLENFTGKSFVEQFIDAVYTIHTSKEIFIDAVTFSEHLKDLSTSNWFLVTSAEHNKPTETHDLKVGAQEFLHKDSFIILNKSVQTHLPHSCDQYSSNVNKVINSIIEKEKCVYNDLLTSGIKTIRFQDILDSSPQVHVTELSKNW